MAWNKRDIIDLITRKAKEAGIDPTHALTMASVETGGTFNPGMTSPTGYKGLYQFGPSEWKTWGGGKDINDPEANADAFVGYHNEIRDQMKSRLGRDPTPQELYLGWQQGAKGASDLLADPARKAADVVPAANILANGGTANMTAGDFANLWGNKYGEHQGMIVPGMPPAQNIGMGTQPAMQMADANPRTAGDADLAGYGGSPKVPGLLYAQPDFFSMAGRAGAGLLGASQPVDSWKPQAMPNLPAHFGDPQAIAMLPDFVKRRIGLLG